ncbi:MAG: hypothetical protein KDK27_20410, partial [Leptospiraceae bacterium]|nr:hypothetical protein [Leptospiraceae bacterium]
MFASIYLNFFTVSIVIGTAFYLIIGLILLLAIPDRTKATTHFGISYVISAVLAAAFIPAHMLYEPIAAYHRWLSVPAALLVHCHYAQIFYHFPETRWRKAARIILGIQYCMAIILTGYFYYVTAHSAIVYNFSAHLWDFDADDASKLVGAMILLNIGHIFVSGMLNVIFRPGHRLVIGGMLAALMFAVTIPSITNIMGRNGLISWDVHQTFLIINSVTGMFALLVIFLNHAKERTSFMLKIVGMSMVTFMVLLIYISLTSFQDQEQAYDRLRSEQASRLSIEP